MRLCRHAVLAVAVAAAAALLYPLHCRAENLEPDARVPPSSGYLTCPAQATFYVGPSGSDANPGTLHAPFLTIQKAVAAATATIARGMKGDIIIFLRGGDYRLEKPLKFGPANSGRNHCKLVLQSYPGERAIIDGGRRISGWTLYDAARNIYRAQVGRDWNFRQLYVNGSPARRARMDFDRADLQRTPKGFAVAQSSAADWADTAGAEVVILGKWMTIRCMVTAAAPGSITMAEPCWKNAQWAVRWGATLPSWIENKYRFLDHPGDWFLDRNSGYLYYVARPGENVATADITAPVAEDLIIGDGAHDLMFRNLRFMLSNWTMPDDPDGYVGLQEGYHRVGTDDSLAGMHSPIRFSRSRVIIFEGNTFRQLGSTALSFDRGSQYIFVLRNRFVDIAGGAMQFGQIEDGGEANLDKQNRYYIIRDNYIKGIGFEYFDNAAVAGFYVADMVVEHNTIDSVPHYGISVGWGWGKGPSYTRDNRIGWNYIHNFAKLFSDSSGIYTLGSAPGTIIHDNYLSGIGKGFCLYPDEGSAYQHWTLNRCEHVEEWLHAWTASVHDNYITRNFTDTATAEVKAPENDIRENVVVPDRNWPAEALRIKAEAGIRATDDASAAR